MNMMRYALIIIRVAVFLSVPALCFAQFPGERTAPAPVQSGLSSLERNADAYMSNNGYWLVPNLTKYGSVSGNSPATSSISLTPGRWAIAVLNWNNSTCTLDAYYRDAGYTPGTEKHPSSAAPGFRFVPLNIESTLSGVLLSVNDASAQPGNRSSRCGFELRFYSFTKTG